MAAFDVPSAPTVYRSVYTDFRGCDFTTDAGAVDDRRFPDALNLILDTKGYPEKRCGYRNLWETDGCVHKLYRGVVRGEPILFSWEGDEVHIRRMTPTMLWLRKITDVQNCFFVPNVQGVYIFCKHENGGAVYLFAGSDEGDGYALSEQTEALYVPKTSAGGIFLTDENIQETSAPSAGFTALEAVNLLTGKRSNGYGVSELPAENEDLCFTNRQLIYTDSAIVFSDEAKHALRELYLRAFCVNPADSYTSATVYEVHASAYYEAWKAFYGNEEGERQYVEWLRKIKRDDSYGADTFYRKHAKELYNFTKDNAVLSRYVRTYGYGLGTEESFKISVLGNDGAYTELPMFFYNEGYAENEERFTFFWTIKNDDVLNDSSVPTVCDTTLAEKRIVLYRFAFYADKAKKRPYDLRPDIRQVENVLVHFGSGTGEESNKIFTSTVTAQYGVLGTADRVFVAGTGTEQHYVRYSAMDNPLYFPDLNYITAGNSTTRVTALFPINGCLVAAKEPNGQDVNLFLISGTMQEGEAVFTVSEGVSGTGVASAGAVCLVDDTPHFLSDNGVMALVSTEVSERQTTENRSYFIDTLLRNENLQEAVMVYHNRLLLLCFPSNGNCYVLHTAFKTYSDAAGGDHYIYECWRWNNIHARCFFKDGRDLYFGTDSGVMKFNFDLEGTARYNDCGQPIEAYFRTKAYADNTFLTLKNMRKRGSGIIIKPFQRSSAEVAVVTDNAEQALKTISGDILDFTQLEFTRFEFSSNTAIRIIPFNQKVKKYATLQFVVRNAVLGESFGVIGIEKAYTFGNYKKN